jgi:methyltransferase
VTKTLFLGAAMFGLMLAEARVSRAHERGLRERGAVQPPGDAYRTMAVLYPLCFVVLMAEGLWRASQASVVPLVDGPAWWISGLILFVASKGLKYWAIGSLGDRWSFKVLVEPGRPLVHTGPYRYLRHPNYVAVVGELAGAAMMVGAPLGAPIVLVAFGAVLIRRLRFEERVLASIGDRS